MPLKHLRFRLSMLAAAAVFLAVALAIRALSAGSLYSNGRLEQYSGNALYASMTYAGTLFLWPPLRPLLAGGTALAWCWAMECFQLTGLPAELSAHSLLARLVLGVQFDPTDLLWYPAGIVPLVAVHQLLLRRVAIWCGWSSRPTGPTGSARGR
ncbi:DUF2809 domain-containing protein [Dactylosporangium salmoneum]|uniref:ribosomal maturation YjgA family protein n=1 Tax=Dactylosporangium salmoneum TaxID=53361 RepID=UPI0031DF4ADD